jgi:hypothetical protein
MRLIDVESPPPPAALTAIEWVRTGHVPWLAGIVKVKVFPDPAMGCGPP